MKIFFKIFISYNLLYTDKNKQRHAMRGSATICQALPDE